jgi:hypothetical protein
LIRSGARNRREAAEEGAILRPNSVLVVAGMGHMSGFAEPWIPGFDPATGALVLPLWSAAVVAAVLVASCVFILLRAGRDRMIEA